MTDMEKKSRILLDEDLTDMEKLQKVFDLSKEFLKQSDVYLYYAILAVLDKEKKPDASGYFGR